MQSLFTGLFTHCGQNQLSEYIFLLYIHYFMDKTKSLNFTTGE